VEDDYTWVLHSRSRSLADLARHFIRDNGFYRPVVSMSFAVNEWLFGAAPLGYGLANVALALVDGSPNRSPNCVVLRCIMRRQR
jgi:hypothetical protein